MVMQTRSTYGVSPQGANPLAGLVAGFQQREAAARAANIKRMQTIEAIFDEIVARYGPGGTYGRAAEAILERQKVRDVGAAEIRDISRGLYGVADRPAMWEETVGAPARMRLEDIKMERLSAAQMAQAGFLERIQQPYPDYGALMQAAAAAGGMGGGAAPITYGAPTPSAFGSEALWAERAAYGKAPTVPPATAKPVKTGVEWAQELAAIPKAPAGTPSPQAGMTAEEYGEWLETQATITPYGAAQPAAGKVKVWSITPTGAPKYEWVSPQEAAGKPRSIAEAQKQKGIFTMTLR